MAKYKTEKGFAVQTLSTDSITSQIAGGSWSAGGNLPGQRDETAGGGTLTAGIQFGGYSPSPAGYITEANEYNGTAWSEGGNMSSGRSNFGGAGTQTAALAIGGQSPGVPAGLTATEEYNGSSWTSGGALPAGYVSNYGCTGTQTAALNIAGYTGSARVAKTLSYNGSSWSDTSNDVPVTLDRNGASGTTTAAITGGGREGSPGSYTNKFFTYNGSSWTAITTYPISASMISMQGPYTDVIAANGLVPPGSTNSNWWDGTAWTAAPSTSNYHGQCAHANSTAGATSGDGFIAGSDPSGYNGTEHWNSAPSIFTKTNLGQVYYNSGSNAFKVTKNVLGTGAWASGGNLNTARGFGAAFGTQTSSIYAAGYTGTNSPAVESYNGTSWSEVAEVNTVRRELLGFGTGSAGLKIGGRPPSVTDVESWNGSSWTEVNNLNTARSDSQCMWGTLTSGLVATGYNGSTTVANVEAWDGTSWTETTDVNTARNYAMGFGASSAEGLAIGGDPNRAIVEQYDGSSWTEIADINTGRQHGSASGTTSTSGIIFAGYDPNGMEQTEEWNGSSWTELADLATARYGCGGSTNGSSALGLAFGGYPGPLNNTEEWTVPSTVTNTTITVS